MRGVNQILQHRPKADGQSGSEFMENMENVAILSVGEYFMFPLNSGRYLRDQRCQERYCTYLDTIHVFCVAAAMSVSHMKPDSSLHKAKEASPVVETTREKQYK